jgi:hypothetical protein
MVEAMNETCEHTPWIEMYGEMEEWVKRAQNAHAKADALYQDLQVALAERDEAIRDLNEFRDGLTRVLNDHGVPAMACSWEDAIGWLVNEAYRNGYDQACRENG